MENSWAHEPPDYDFLIHMVASGWTFTAILKAGELSVVVMRQPSNSNVVSSVTFRGNGAKYIRLYDKMRDKQFDKDVKAELKRRKDDKDNEPLTPI